MSGGTRRFVLLCVTAGVSALMALPVLWMLFGSLRTDTEILTRPFSLPEAWRLGQWKEAWQVGGLGRLAWNSAWITATAVALTVIAGAAAGYALVRGPRWAGRLAPVYLLGMIFPAQCAVVPTFSLLRALQLLDSGWGLVFAYAAWNLPVTVFLFAGFFRAQPLEPEQAAELEGCGPAARFWRVALPIAAPAAGVAGLLAALSCWNEFLFALLFIHSEESRTLPLGVLAFSTAHQTDYGLTLAALSIASLPMLVLYAFIHRRLIDAAAGLIA